MRLFEGGIYSKITEEEYQKLRQKQAGSITDNKIVSEGANEIGGSESRLNAMSMKTLQGAFYILIIGYILSGKCEIFSCIIPYIHYSERLFISTLLYLYS